MAEARNEASERWILQLLEGYDGAVLRASEGKRRLVLKSGVVQKTWEGKTWSVAGRSKIAIAAVHG